MKKNMLIATCIFLFTHCQPNEKYRTTIQQSGGYSYESVTNDPTNTRIYTLDNGLKVYLSKLDNSPRIQTFTVIKAGSKNDPANNTGLAHYLEHMMFKGTDQFGTKNYSEEKVLLDSIESLFNHYGKLTDPEKRKSVFKQIDKLSYKAAEFAIPNEFDKMISLIGGKGLNANTSNDRTLYTADIPANEIERFLKIEGARFKKIVNRLFHTELEAVYEEKNHILDDDYWKAYDSMQKHIFLNHPYGQQSVLGTIDHLKNPSITAIKSYFNTYYRPNNAAICMSRDLDYDTTIALIDQYFGDWEASNDLPIWDPIKEPELTKVVEAEVFGPQKERIYLGYRFVGTHSEDHMKIILINLLLNNSTAGLIELNLEQQQKLLAAWSNIREFNDYNIHILSGTPKAGQSLTEVKELLLEQINAIKQGEFDEWLLDAVVNQLKKIQMIKEDSKKANYYRASEMVKAFTNDTPWKDRVSFFDKISTITKEELVAFANTHYKENYVLIKKRNGEDLNAQKVEKPLISKVPLNREVKSTFHKEIAQIKTANLEPKFVDFKNDLQHYKIGEIPVIHRENIDNDLFELTYIFDFAQNADPILGLALTGFLNYVGTREYTPKEIKQEFYKLGCTYRVRGTRNIDRFYITLKGLNENFEASLSLFEHLLEEATGTDGTLKKLVDRILKQREDSIKDKDHILWNGLYNYAVFGKKILLINCFLQKN